MKRVLVESPYAGDVRRNLAYLKRCMLDCLDRDEAPFASHMLYTQFLDDNKPDERAIGIEAGLIWGEAAHKTVVYQDLGLSNGMRRGIERAEADHRPIEFRRLWEKGCVPDEIR